MPDREVYSSVFIRAAEILGGTEQLAAYLSVSPSMLADWATGRAEPPPEMFLRVVDIHVEHTLKGLISSVSSRPADAS